MARAGMAVLVAILLSGCGSDPKEDEVRKTVEGFAQAIAKRDYQALCDRYFSSKLIGAVEQAGLPCEAAIRPEISATEKPTLKINSIRLDGDKAQVQVHTTAANQPPSDDTLALVREQDTWRIASLAQTGPQPTAP